MTNTLRDLVLRLRYDAVTPDEALRQIVDFVYWNSRSTEESPLQSEFAQLQAEGLVESGFYEEVIDRWNVRKQSWV